MKNIKNIILILAAVIGFAAHAEHPWKKYKGCYVTLEWNGEAVEPREYGFSFITFAEESVFVDQNGKDIPNMLFVLYEKEVPEENATYFGWAEAFENLGKYSSDSSGDHFEFRGSLNTHEGTEMMFHSKISLKKRP